MRNSIMYKRLRPSVATMGRTQNKLKSFRQASLKEMKSIGFWRSAVCECLGTFFYVLGGCITLINSGSTVTNPLHTAVTFGFMSATLTQCFGHISGAHLNPAVSVGLCVTCKISISRCLVYSVAQCGGAVVAAALLHPLFGERCCGETLTTRPLGGLTGWQAMGLELLITFIVVLTVFATVDPSRKMLGSQPLAIGMAVFAAHLVLVNWTGCGVNPARSFGPALTTNTWQHHWAYWIGPLCGGVLAGLLYQHVLRPQKEEAKQTACSPYNTGGLCTETANGPLPAVGTRNYQDYQGKTSGADSWRPRSMPCDQHFPQRVTPSPGIHPLPYNWTLPSSSARTSSRDFPSVPVTTIEN